jgi:hypothetical protein
MEGMYEASASCAGLPHRFCLSWQPTKNQPLHMRLNFLSNIPISAGALLLAIYGATPARADYSSTVLGQNPVGYWRLNETTLPLPGPLLATNIGSAGSRGNGAYIAANRGVFPGAIVSDPSNASVGFDGLVSSNRVRIPFQPEWNPSGPLTVEFWAKPAQTAALESPASSVEFISSPATQRNGWLFYQGNSTLADGNGFLFRQYNNSGLASQSGASVNLALDTNQWYHVVGVFDGTNISTYVNGALGATAVFTSTPRPNTNILIPLTFGARADGAAGYFTYSGQIDEAAVYDAALSPGRILAHYQAGTNAAPATPYSQVILADAPAGYWRFNEPTDPPASNLGTFGSAANASYVFDAKPGAAGPRSPTYPGFDSANKAVSLDGGGGYVSVPALNLDTNTVTITGWMNASGSQDPGAGIILSRSGSTVAGITMDIGGGLALSYNWNDDPSTYNWASGVSLADSDWTYVALVIAPDHAALYSAAGTNVASWTTATNFAAHVNQAFEGPTFFGADFQTATNLFFRGSIDEVAIFNRSLNEGELYSAYGAAVGAVGPQIFSDVSAPVSQPYLGDTLNLVIDAGGTPSLSYTWRKNGSAITGANTSSFVINNLKSTDSATYDVVVTNTFGKVTSSGALISVQTPTAPVVTQGPVGRTLYPGGFLDLTVEATGGQLQYQWQLAGTNIPGAIASSYIVQSVTAADAGIYKVTITNSIGNAAGGPVTVNVVAPAANSYESVVIADSPEAWWRLDEPVGSTTMVDSMGRHDGTYVGSGVTLGAPGVIANGTPDSAATFDGTSYGDVPYSSKLNSSEFTIEAWAFITDDTATRSVVSTYDTSSHKGIFFKANPDGTWESDVGLNDNFVWYFAPMGQISSGHWAHLAATFSASAGQINYLNGQEISGPFNDFVRNGKFDFLIGGVGTNFQGIARWKGTLDEVAVYTHALTADRIQKHYVQALYGSNTKPIFLAQPQPVTIAQGDPASFTAQVEGSIPLSFQWLKNGAAILNATNLTLPFGAAAFSDTATYQLMAVNPAGTNSSTAVTLTVLPPIRFANATNGLFLHLKFDGDYSDSSGRGNNGTAVGAPSFVTGQVGKALHYSTSTDTGASGGTVTNADYVSLGNPPDLQFGATTSFTVAFWIRLPNGYLDGDLPFLGSAINSANNQGFTFCPSYQLGGWQWDIEQITASTTNNVDVNGPDNSINDGVFHHFAVTFDRDAAVALTYLDGTQVQSTSIASVGAFDSPNSITIGQDPTGMYPEPGSADMDDLGVWRRALSPLEIYEIFYSGSHFGAALDTYGPLSLSVGLSATSPVITWQVGKLYQADSPLGPWTLVPNANPPTYQLSPVTGAKFFRVGQ